MLLSEVVLYLVSGAAGCFVNNPVVYGKCGSDKESGTSRCLGKSSLMVTSWNCRGLSNTLPYIGALIDGGSSILVLSEHWLWPCELEKLSEISDEYEALGKADKRLTENAECGRGCGGIGMLWRKDIGATAISGISSDRICGIRFTVDNTDGSVMSVVGVYLPCLDQGMDIFREYLVELEHVISELELLGPVVVTGDFNAHLGKLGGSRGAGDVNVQGVLLHEMMGRCNLSAVSLGSIASGPGYAYQCGEVHTTVDYVLMDVEAASVMLSCSTHCMDDLNTLDHLPLTARLAYVPCPQGDMQKGQVQPRINWDKARRTGEIDDYVSEVQSRTAPFLNSTYDKAQQVDDEMRHVAWLLAEAAEKTLPQVQGRRTSMYRDNTLSCLCAQSRAAHKAWREAGCPSDGPLYEEKGQLRRAVRRKVRFCAAAVEHSRIQRREKMFASAARGRFNTPSIGCSKLMVDGKMVNHPDALLDMWAQHFGKLAK